MKIVRLFNIGLITIIYRLGLKDQLFAGSYYDFQTGTHTTLDIRAPNSNHYAWPFILLCKGNWTTRLQTNSPTTNSPTDQLANNPTRLQRDSDTTFKVRMSRSPGRFTHRGLNARGRCHGDRENVLGVGNYCYVASARRRARRWGAHRERRGAPPKAEAPAIVSIFAYTSRGGPRACL